VREKTNSAIWGKKKISAGGERKKKVEKITKTEIVFKKHRDNEMIKKIEIEEKRGERYLALRDGDRYFERWIS
jgi:hypothetical protein